MNYGIVKPVLIAFFVSVLLSPMMIRYLHKLKFGQFIRGEGPESHLKKSGTPTMGGVLIIIAILITGLTRSNISSDMVIGLICVVGFGFVGFVDDFIIIKMKRSLGLKPWQKIVMQVALALYVSYYQYSSSPSATQLIIPFQSVQVNIF